MQTQNKSINMECQMVKNSLIIVSHMLTMKYLAIIISRITGRMLS